MTDPTVATVAWAATGLTLITLGVIVMPYLWRQFNTWLDNKIINTHLDHYDAMKRKMAADIDTELHDMADGH